MPPTACTQLSLAGWRPKYKQRVNKNAICLFVLYKFAFQIRSMWHRSGHQLDGIFYSNFMRSTKSSPETNHSKNIDRSQSELSIKVETIFLSQGQHFKRVRQCKHILLEIKSHCSRNKPNGFQNAPYMQTAPKHILLWQNGRNITKASHKNLIETRQLMEI